ncbi:hypothetical protein FB451DRAFT_1187552 [Mycena latifolia]|nr:hypothetical protein FB451DRAFT_1187552 [Mycena latifolia]
MKQIAGTEIGSMVELWAAREGCGLLLLQLSCIPCAGSRLRGEGQKTLGRTGLKAGGLRGAGSREEGLRLHGTNATQCTDPKRSKEKQAGLGEQKVPAAAATFLSAEPRLLKSDRVSGGVRTARDWAGTGKAGNAESNQYAARFVEASDLRLFCVSGSI